MLNTTQELIVTNRYALTTNQDLFSSKSKSRPTFKRITTQECKTRETFNTKLMQLVSRRAYLPRKQHKSLF